MNKFNQLILLAFLAIVGLTGCEESQNSANVDGALSQSIGGPAPDIQLPDLRDPNYQPPGPLGDRISYVGVPGAPGNGPESFSGADGSSFPGPWQPIIESAVTTFESRGGFGKIAATAYDFLSNSVTGHARIVAPDYEITNSETTFDFEFGDPTEQALVYFARQNGDFLNHTAENGMGIGFYVDAMASQIGFMLEDDGVTEVLATTDFAFTSFTVGTLYSVKFEILQINFDETSLKLKVWPSSQSEPTNWHLEITNSNPLLQNLPGGFALDLFNSLTTESLYLDNLDITFLPAPTFVP